METPSATARNVRAICELEEMALARRTAKPVAACAARPAQAAVLRNDLTYGNRKEAHK
jgi:hypothetical protein